MNRPLRVSLCPSLGCILAALALAVPAIAQEGQPTQISGLIDESQKADVLIEYMVVPVEELPLPKGYVHPSVARHGPAFPSPIAHGLRGRKLAARMWLVRVTNRASCPARLAISWAGGLAAGPANRNGWGLQKDGKSIPATYADIHAVHYLTGRANERRLARSITPEYWKELVVLWWGPSHKDAKLPNPTGQAERPKANMEMAALWPGSTTWGYIGFVPKPHRPAKGSPRMLAESQAKWRREATMFYEAQLRCDLGKGVTWAFVENAHLADQIIRDNPRTKTTAVTEQQKSKPRR